jgi:hypothetical protein
VEAVSATEGVAARHSSATVEHYTPPSIVEAARAVLGGIDLDPFSCTRANETVKAGGFYSLEETAFSRGMAGSAGNCGWKNYWHGRVFINPPGGRGPNNESNQKRAWFKLAAEYDAGRVSAAIFVCFSVELLQTTQVKPTGKLPLDFPICYPSKRVAYIREDGTVGGSPPHSSCIVYVPPRRTDGLVCEREAGLDRFRTAFAPIGRVVVPS